MNRESVADIKVRKNTRWRTHAIKTGVLYLVLFSGGLWHLMGKFSSAMTILSGPLIALLGIWIAWEYFVVLPKTKRLVFLTWLVFVGIFSFSIELIGVKTGMIFGEYEYTQVLQPEISGVPLAIGFAWVSILLASRGGVETVFGTVHLNWMIRGIVVALFMVIFDVFLEQAAVGYEYWNWAGSLIPMQNYIAWFVLGFLFTVVGEWLYIFPDKIPSLAKHFYIAQLLYFIPVFFV